VTLMGQSAGGVSTSLQLYSPKPLFKRAALIGGTSLGMKPEGIEFHDKIYPVLLSALGIDLSLPVDEKVRLLKELPEEKWTNLPPIVPSRPVVDGEFLPETPSFKGLSDPSHHAGKPAWLESILLTDCEADVRFW
jgi:carboxylesterase type B